mgnify:CR=1 FL=1
MAPGDPELARSEAMNTPELIVVTPVFEDVEAATRLFGELARTCGRGTFIVAVDDGSVRAPLGALFRLGEDWAAYVVVDGRARLVKVEAGPADDSFRVVRAGLAPGARVILYPGTGISDGTRVSFTWPPATSR